ncbi:hypothetical protein MCEMAEM6B_00858 [Mycobacteriaceae bacterium]
MQISLRSHLIAGTAAVVGASAIAMTPVMGAQLSLPAINVPTVAKVTLAGLDSPLSELLGSVILGGQLLLNTDANAATPGDWGPSAFGTTTGGVFTPYFGADLIAGGLVASGLYLGGAEGDFGVGVLPQIIDDALPIIRQLGINGSDYLNVAVAGLSAAGVALSEGVWNAAGDLLTLDIPGALATLAASISAAGTLALGSGAYVLANVVNRAQAVVEVVLGSLGDLVQATVAQIGVVLAKVGEVVDNTVSATTFEDGWNAAIDGIFGATGIPGTVLNVTVGAGQVVNGNTPDTAFVPSVRTVVRGAVVGIQEALATPLPAPTAAAPAAAAPSAASALAASARAASVEAAPAAEAPAADSSEAAPAAEAAEAPAAEVAAPKPARKAARAVRASA